MQIRCLCEVRLRDLPMESNSRLLFLCVCHD
jgi:hypothetical protein